MRVIGGFYNLRLWADCGLGYTSFLVSLKTGMRKQEAKKNGKKGKKRTVFETFVSHLSIQSLFHFHTTVPTQCYRL